MGLPSLYNNTNKTKEEIRSIQNDIKNKRRKPNGWLLENCVESLIFTFIRQHETKNRNKGKRVGIEIPSDGFFSSKWTGENYKCQRVEGEIANVERIQKVREGIRMGSCKKSIESFRFTFILGIGEFHKNAKIEKELELVLKSCLIVSFQSVYLF